MIQSPIEPPPSQGSGSLPDENTSEAILYGSQYSWIKSVLWAWDEMEDYLLHKAHNLEGQVMDRKFAYDVLRGNRYLIFARSPPVNDVRQLKDLFTLRSLIRTEVALKKIREYRKQNLAYARKKGIEEYVRGLAGRGISEAEWKAATAPYNMEPITYDYVHGLTPDMLPGEDFDWAEAMTDLMGVESYNRLVERMLGGQSVPEFMDPEVDDYIDTEEESDDDGDIEEESDDEMSAPEWWGELLDVMGLIFDDPIARSLETMTPDYDDLCSDLSDWLMDTVIDDRYIIDGLIEMAAEVSL